MRVELMAAYVLHTRPYRNTSLLVDAFTLGQGRVLGVAKGAQRARAALQATTHLFTPLELSWLGASDLRLQGRALMSGLYVNELLVKLLHKGDSHEQLFWRYDRVLHELASGCDAAVSLRLFEKTVVAEMGFGLCFERDASSCPLEPTAWYCFDPECGVRVVTAPEIAAASSYRESVPTHPAAPFSQAVTGKTLMDLGRETLSSADASGEAKRFLGSVIQHCLGDATLQSRLIWRRSVRPTKG
ncbi:MAG: recombination protein O N-terminal domain-containing protein [Gammaproteobacteria bacterium]